MINRATKIHLHFFFKNILLVQLLITKPNNSLVQLALPHKNPY